MNDFDGTPAFQIKEWFLKEDSFESFNMDAELISLEIFAVTSVIEKQKKLIRE